MTKTEYREGVASMEWAVEIYKHTDYNFFGGFVSQIDVFQSYEDARNFAKSGNIELGDDEHIEIIYIEYDESENEIGCGVDERWLHELNTIVVDTDYIVEVNNDRGFVRQLEAFETLEAADNYAENSNIELKEGEYLNIIFVDYNYNGDEIDFGSVV